MMRTRGFGRLLAGAALCCLSGCGGATYPPEGTLAPSPVDCGDDDASACERELHAKRVELTALLERSAAGELGTAPPDCASARELRDRICDLAAAICTLAARNSTSHELQARCSSAETTCSQARDDVAHGCDR